MDASTMLNAHLMQYMMLLESLKEHPELANDLLFHTKLGSCASGTNVFATLVLIQMLSGQVEEMSEVTQETSEDVSSTDLGL